jgi:hypothetical protein
VTSQELIRAYRAGAEILHNGAPVSYRPRFKNDRTPWLWTDGRTECRYPASGCQAYTPTEDDK